MSPMGRILDRKGDVVFLGDIYESQKGGSPRWFLTPLTGSVLSNAPVNREDQCRAKSAAPCKSIPGSRFIFNDLAGNAFCDQHMISRFYRDPGIVVDRHRCRFTVIVHLNNGIWNCFIRSGWFCPFTLSFCKGFNHLRDLNLLTRPHYQKYAPNEHNNKWNHHHSTSFHMCHLFLLFFCAKTIRCFILAVEWQFPLLFVY